MVPSTAVGTEQPSLYDRLRSAVLNGEYPPGTILVETVLADNYGVSRTPVREALLSLQKDGILQYNGRHLMVRVSTLEEVMEMYDCRIVLEGVAAGWAARSRTDNDLVLLELALDEMVRASGRPPFELATINHAFHERLWRSSHNATLVDLLARLEVHIRRYPESTLSEPGRWEQAVAEHSAIIDAIRAQDENLAKRLGSEHMIAARDLRLQMVGRIKR